MQYLFAACLSLVMISARAEIINVGNDDFKKLVAAGAKVVDVRTAGEWRQTGVVAGSHLITLFDEQGRTNPAWLDTINQLTPAPAPVVLICRTGKRSAVAAKMLNDAAPTRRIYNVSDGITGWTRANQPVVSLQQNVLTAGIRCAPVC